MKHTLAWQDGDKVTLKYRDVHARTLTNDVQYLEQKKILKKVWMKFKKHMMEWTLFQLKIDLWYLTPI